MNHQATINGAVLGLCGGLMIHGSPAPTSLLVGAIMVAFFNLTWMLWSSMQDGPVDEPLPIVPDSLKDLEAHLAKPVSTGRTKDLEDLITHLAELDASSPSLGDAGLMAAFNKTPLVLFPRSSAIH